MRMHLFDQVKQMISAVLETYPALTEAIIVLCWSHLTSLSLHQYDKTSLTADSELLLNFLSLTP